MANQDNQQNISYIDEERVVALDLSVKFWAGVAANAKATPATTQKVLETADIFYSWLLK